MCVPLLKSGIFIVSSQDSWLIWNLLWGNHPYIRVPQCNKDQWLEEKYKHKGLSVYHQEPVFLIGALNRILNIQLEKGPIVGLNQRPVYFPLISWVNKKLCHSPELPKLPKTPVHERRSTFILEKQSHCRPPPSPLPLSGFGVPPMPTYCLTSLPRVVILGCWKKGKWSFPPRAPKAGLGFIST